MDSRKKKISTKLHAGQVENKACKGSNYGRVKKLSKSAQHYLAQIATLKANNTSLATALDEMKQDCRKLQEDNLRLQQERQCLLEQVASLESKLAKNGIKESVEPALKLLQEAQSKLQEVRVVLEDQKTYTKLPVQSPNIKPAETPKKILRFSSPSQSEACTIYPRTPHPLHNMTCVVDGPQLASTPVCTESSSPLMNLSPHMINYSDSEEEESSLSNEHSHKQPNGEEYKTVSPTVEKQSLQDQSNHANKSTNSTLDQLEAALTHDGIDTSLQRPRRRCVSLSMSYQEPSLNRKLRRGDPFTEHATDWSPPDQRERAKRSIKKSATSGKRKTLQNITNQQI